MASTTTTSPAPVLTPLFAPAQRPAPDAAPSGGRPAAAPGLPDLGLTPREIARSLAGRTELWRPLVRYTEPRFHTRIATGPTWEAWLLTWLPGQSTALHDHGGSAGAFAVLAGTVDEDVLVPRAPGAPGGAHLTGRRLRAGQVRAFGSHHVHDVAARGGRRAVTLHVYAPRLTIMTRYVLADGELVVTSREQEGQDW